MLCARCRYWDCLAAHADEETPVTESDLGRCRRHAPTPTGTNGRGIWPLTLAADWCGAFADRGRDEL